MSQYLEWFCINAPLSDLVWFYVMKQVSPFSYKYTLPCRMCSLFAVADCRREPLLSGSIEQQRGDRHASEWLWHDCLFNMHYIWNTRVKGGESMGAGRWRGRKRQILSGDTGRAKGSSYLQSSGHILWVDSSSFLQRRLNLVLSRKNKSKVRKRTKVEKRFQ